MTAQARELQAATRAAGSASSQLRQSSSELREYKERVGELAGLLRQVAARAMRADPLSPREMHELSAAVQQAMPPSGVGGNSPGGRQGVRRQPPGPSASAS